MHRNVHYIEKTVSTNSLLRGDEWPDYAVAYTFNQTGGRGRENRRWQCIPGRSLALSIKLPLTGFPLSPVWSVALLSVSMTEMLVRSGMHHLWIKWPNDIYAADVKLAGVLSETHSAGGTITHIIAGIGINVNTDADDFSGSDFTATSVYLESSQLQDMTEFANAYIDALTALLKRDNLIAHLKERWIALSGMTDREFVWQRGEDAVTGRVAEICDDGALLFDTGNERLRIDAGDLCLKGYEK